MVGKQMKIAVFVASALLCSVGASAATAPLSGTYAANILIGSVSGSGCLDKSGNQFAGVVNYAGLSGTRLGIRIPTIYNGAPIISTQYLTVKSGVGTTHPGGAFTWTGISSDGQQWNISGTFSATITEMDTFSFIAAVTETYSGCTEHLSVGVTRVGAKQS
jgi:hypothetical protein